MTLYFTAVSNDLLSVLRAGKGMPACLRLRREIGPVLSPVPRPGWTLVEFEDDEAPPEMAGRMVTPTIRGTRVGGLLHTTVVSRDVEIEE